MTNQESAPHLDGHASPEALVAHDAEVHASFMARTKSFTRRSRALPEHLRATVEKFGGQYIVPVRRGVGWTTVAEDFVLDVPELFGRSAPLVVEIGPGNGEQIVASAVQNPTWDYLAFEVWQPGIAKLVSAAAEAGVTNVRVIEADAQQAIPLILNEGCARDVWTFFPDPWRKARHRKRRLVSDAFAGEIARILEDGGLWRLATDWEDYAWQMRDVIEGAEDFANPYEGERPDPRDPEGERGGFAPRFPGRVRTHFEERGHVAGRDPHDIVGVRIPRSSPS